MSSQAKFEIIFTFVGTKKIIKGEFLRLKSPQTFEALNDKIREQGHYTVRSRGNIGSPKSYWMILVNLNKSGEKDEYKDIKVGDIVYCPRQDALYIIYDDPKIRLPVYYFGKVTEGLNILESKDLRNGIMVKIELKEI